MLHTYGTQVPIKETSRFSHGSLKKSSHGRELRFPETKSLSIYHDNPELTDDDKLRVSVGITAGEDTGVSGEVGKMLIEGGKYALGRFELAGDEYGKAWQAMYGEWLPQSGFQPDDRPCFELYHNNPEEHPEGTCILDICIPVKPM